MNRRYLILIIILTLSIAKIGASSPITSTPNVLTVSNTIVQIGQNTVVSTIISGGSNGPYSGQFTWFNSNQINNQVVNTIVVGPNSQSVAFNPSGTLAYAIMENSPGTVNVIQVSSNTVVNTIVVGPNSQSVAFNPSGTLAYVTNLGGTVNVIQVSSNTVINTITVGSEPYGVAFNPSGTLAYVANSGGTTVSVVQVSSNTVINTTGVGSI
jgi:YVTN family beta-propeller protein